jgi:hypothetical protein
VLTELGAQGGGGDLLADMGFEGLVHGCRRDPWPDESCWRHVVHQPLAQQASITATQLLRVAVFCRPAITCHFC